MIEVDPAGSFARFADSWNPWIACELNAQHVKLVKLTGESAWHENDHEDEIFLAVRGQFRMEFRDRQI